MAIPEKQKKYNAKNIKRIPLDMQLSYYNDVLMPAVAENGTTVNGFIKEAIAEKIERNQSDNNSVYVRSNEVYVHSDNTVYGRSDNEVYVHLTPEERERAEKYAAIAGKDIVSFIRHILLSIEGEPLDVTTEKMRDKYIKNRVPEIEEEPDSDGWDLPFS